MRTKIYKVGEIASVQTGPFGSQLHQKDYVNQGTPIITVEHLGENRINHSKDIPCVSEIDRNRLSKYWLEKGDIVFSRVGSVDRRAYVTEKEHGWLFSGRCLRVRVTSSKVNPLLLSYYFGLPVFKEHIRRIAVGATMPSINTSILSGVEVSLPELEVQNSIADLLVRLDDKIELNQRMNETLEQMAQTLYKHWFVDFGPFQDGEFVESKLGEIPRGWEVKRNKDVLTLTYGKALKQKDRQPGNIPVIGSGGQVDWHNQSIAKGPSIVIGRKGNAGKITWIHQDFYPIDTTFYVTGNLLPMSYILYSLRSQSLDRLGTDSAVPGLNRDVAYEQLLLVPDGNATLQFDQRVTQLFNLIHCNNIENQRLTRIRDFLLPRLLSGEIEIKEAAEHIKEVITHGERSL